ncbi:MAG: IS1595 family transposase [Acidimicrobiales bacterium]
MEKFSVLAIANRIPDEASAYRFLEELRWGKDADPTCPHCSSVGAYFLNPNNGTSRKTRTGSASQRRVWKCKACRKQFSVLTGTIFHGTKVAVRTWIFVIFEMCASKNGVAAREIERKYDLTPKTAWFMLHRIREAMKREPLVGMLEGTVVADETFIGGKPGNKHRQGQRRKPIGAGSQSGPAYDKTAVLSLVDTESGEVRSQVVADVSGPTLRKAITEQVNTAATTLHTDEAPAYKTFSAEAKGHESVNHGRHEYVRYTDAGIVSTNVAEGYFSQLKRSIDGTHHHVSRKHLPRYLAEFDFRYSTHEISDTQRMRTLVDRVGGRRLTYRPVLDG